MSVTIYSTPTCPYCKMAKEYLRRHNISFRDVDVSTNRKAAETMIKKSGQMGVPVIVVNGKVIIGFNVAELNEALKGQKKASARNTVKKKVVKKVAKRKPAKKKATKKKETKNVVKKVKKKVAKKKPARKKVSKKKVVRKKTRKKVAKKKSVKKKPARKEATKK